MGRTLIKVEDFYSVFPGIKRSSWRWECQGYYETDEDELQQWREGKPHVESEGERRWVQFQQGLKEAGIPFERVRMLTEPLTEYLEWMLDITDWNVNAGEDIRWLPESKARELDMPRYDFYLFDDNRIVILRHDDDKALTGAEVIDDADVVAQHQDYRQRVWPLAIPHREYVKRGSSNGSHSDQPG